MTNFSSTYLSRCCLQTVVLQGILGHIIQLRQIIILKYSELLHRIRHAHGRHHHADHFFEDLYCLLRRCRDAGQFYLINHSRILIHHLFILTIVINYLIQKHGIRQSMGNMEGSA